MSCKINFLLSVWVGRLLYKWFKINFMIQFWHICVKGLKYGMLVVYNSNLIRVSMEASKNCNILRSALTKLLLQQDLVSLRKSLRNIISFGNRSCMDKAQQQWQYSWQTNIVVGTSGQNQSNEMKVYIVQQSIEH